MRIKSKGRDLFSPEMEYEYSEVTATLWSPDCEENLQRIKNIYFCDALSSNFFLAFVFLSKFNSMKVSRADGDNLH